MTRVIFLKEVTVRAHLFSAQHSIDTSGLRSFISDRRGLGPIIDGTGSGQRIIKAWIKAKNSVVYVFESFRGWR